MILVATTWIQAFTGTNFDFSSYSSDLKSVLGISQVQLNYLSVASDMGKVFGWCSGVSLMYFPLWVVMFMAAFLGLFGYGLQWMVMQSIISVPYFVVSSLYIFFFLWKKQFPIEFMAYFFLLLLLFSFRFFSFPIRENVSFVLIKDGNRKKKNCGYFSKRKSNSFEFVNPLLPHIPATVTAHLETNVLYLIYSYSRRNFSEAKSDFFLFSL